MTVRFLFFTERPHVDLSFISVKARNREKKNLGQCLSPHRPSSLCPPPVSRVPRGAASRGASWVQRDLCNVLRHGLPLQPIREEL